ncbi:MAG TPA: O-antigen ligase family protein [Patescibacteria group bacterium]
MAILIFSLIFLFFSFSLGELTRISIYSQIAFSLLDISVFIFVTVTLVKEFLQRKIKITTIWKSFFLFLGCAFFSLFLAAFYIPQSQVLVGILYLLRFILYGYVFFVAINLEMKEKRIIKIGMIITGTCMVVSGIIQFFFYPSLRNLYYGGWDEHLYRMFGTFLDPNFFGLFLVLFMLFIFTLLWTAKNRIFKFIFGCITIITFISILLTYSRSSLFALVIGFSSLFYILGRKKFVLYSLICMSVIGGLFFIWTGGRSEGTNLFRTTSTQERLTNAKNALTVWSDNILFGVGFNTYSYAQYRHGIIKSVSDEGHGNSGADNSFLFILATVGVSGFLAFLYMIFQHYKILQNQSQSYKALGIASFLGLSAGSFFVNGLFYPPLMLWMWLLLGIIENN